MASVMRSPRALEANLSVPIFTSLLFHPAGLSGRPPPLPRGSHGPDASRRPLAQEAARRHRPSGGVGRCGRIPRGARRPGRRRA